MNHHSKPILLVEDNEDDIFFMRQSVQKAGIRNPIEVTEDGQQALDYLQGTGLYVNRTRFPLPLLVLLDLKLPLVMGLDVLRWIRERPEIKKLLVVVLTSSSLQSDIDTAYELGANSYLVKPPSAVELAGLMQCLRDYWLGRNQPPSDPE